MSNIDLQKEISEYNANILLRMRRLCVEKDTSITKIEKALGYGNGTVSGWKKAKKRAPLDRIVAIAEFLEVPVSALTGEDIDKTPDQNKKPAATNDSELKDPEAFMRLQQVNDMYLSFDEAKKAQVLAYMKFLASQQ